MRTTNRTRQFSWIAVLTLAAMLLPARQAGAQVNDNAGMFSPQAVQKAEAQIADLRQKYGKQLLIETFAEIPAEMRGSYSEERKAEFFNRWAQSRANERNVNGVYVLISKQPSYVTGWVGRETEKLGFGTDDRDKLTSIILQRFRSRDYDGGLLAGTEFVRQTFDRDFPAAGRKQPGASGAPVYQSNAPPPAVRTPPRTSVCGTLGKTFFFVLLAIVGIKLLFSFLRRRAMSRPQYGTGYGAGGPGVGGMGNPGGGYGGGYPPPTQGGGGFGKGVMGGVLGGLAGSWIGNRWFGQGNQAHGAPPSPDAPPSSGMTPDYPPDAGQGDVGGGGSWDNSGAGGGDFGGGGDAGGGGDFGGGGGGDVGGGGEF